MCNCPFLVLVLLHAWLLEAHTVLIHQGNSPVLHIYTRIYTSFSCVATSVETNDNTFQVFANSTQYEKFSLKSPQFLCKSTLPGQLAFQNATSHYSAKLNSSESRNSASLDRFKSITPPGLIHALFDQSL